MRNRYERVNMKSGSSSPLYYSRLYSSTAFTSCLHFLFCPLVLVATSTNYSDTFAFDLAIQGDTMRSAVEVDRSNTEVLQHYAAVYLYRNRQKSYGFGQNSAYQGKEIRKMDLRYVMFESSRTSWGKILFRSLPKTMSFLLANTVQALGIKITLRSILAKPL